jgi:hypothetical protein
MPYHDVTIAQRGKVARLVAAVQQHKPATGEHRSTMKCICGATLHFAILSNGISRAHCSAACGIRWSH